jgi:hypothetical protein
VKGGKEEGRKQDKAGGVVVALLGCRKEGRKE